MMSYVSIFAGGNWMGLVFSVRVDYVLDLHVFNVTVRKNC